jgi:Na+/H+ antiporter NhaC
MAADRDGRELTRRMSLPDPVHAPLVFRGGTAGALAPFAVFLAGVATLALNGAPDEKGFWPVLLAALVTGLALVRDRARWCDALLDGMSQRLVMVMIVAWLLAGVLGAVLVEAGLVASLAQLARGASVSPTLYVGAVFLACALVSTATGTSFGTILLCGPVLYPAASGLGVMPAALMGAILAGATWGDSMSPLSDTSIASSGTQQVDLGGTVRTRLVYAVPAGLVAIGVSMLLANGTLVIGTGTPVQSWARFTASSLAPTASLRPLWLAVVPVGAIAMLLARRHLVESLLVAVAAAVGLGLALGVLAPGDVLRIDAARFGATGVIVQGMERAIGVSVFTLLLSGLVSTLQATRVLERLVAAVATRARTPRAAEGWIVAMTSAAVVLTTHSVVAILAVGEMARRTGAAQGIDGYRRANLLDLTVCTWPFLLPFFLPTILASGATRSGAELGMPVLTAWQVGAHNTYAWALAGMVAVAVGTGYGRRGERRAR